MQCGGKGWLGTVLVGLAGLALTSPAAGQELSIENPGDGAYAAGDPPTFAAPSMETLPPSAAHAPSATPALGRGRAWLLPGRTGERAPLWRGGWRRGASSDGAAYGSAEGAVQPGSPEAAHRPLFSGQFLARGRAFMSRLRQNADSPSAQPSGDSPELQIETGAPEESFASGGVPFSTHGNSPAFGARGDGATSSGPQFNAPQYNAPAYNAPQYNAPPYNAPAYDAPALQLPSVPPDVQVQNGGPELNFEIEAPSSPAPTGTQRSVLAPGSRRGR